MLKEKELGQKEKPFGCSGSNLSPLFSRLINSIWFSKLMQLAYKNPTRRKK
jgi:hypothetical protein